MNTPPPIIKLGCASPHNPIKCLKKCNIASTMLSPTHREMPLFLLVLNQLIVFLLNHSMLSLVPSYYPLSCFTKEASPTEYGLSEN